MNRFTPRLVADELVRTLNRAALVRGHLRDGLLHHGVKPHRATARRIREGADQLDLLAADADRLLLELGRLKDDAVQLPDGLLPALEELRRNG